jgi:hypothetical protein
LNLLASRGVKTNGTDIRRVTSGGEIEVTIIIAALCVVVGRGIEKVMKYEI